MTKIATKKSTKTKATAYDVSEHLRTPEEWLPTWTHGSKKRPKTQRALPAPWTTLLEPKVCHR